MISGRRIPPPAGDVGQKVSSARMAMKPGSQTHGYLNGGWWPRSADPEVEFPGLVSMLGGWVGPVGRVTYNLDEWGSIARYFAVDSRNIRFDGFHSMDAHTVVVIGTDRRQVRLLVVPPDTPGGRARAVLRSVAGSGEGDTVEDILTSNGVEPTRLR